MRQRKFQKALWILAASCLLLLHQNCTSGFETQTLTSSSTSGSQSSSPSSPSPGPSPPPAPAPVPVPSPTPTPSPSPTVGKEIPPLFFGMHFSSVLYQPWPALKFSAFRTWDQYPGVAWRDVNTARGNYNWSNLDTVINTAASRGMEIVYTFGYTPDFASTNPNGNCDGGAPAGSCYAPNLNDWKEFVTQLTSRYKGKIKYYEIWNEPNAGGFWKGTASELASMAQAAASIIHNAGGVVLSPAPQGTNSHLWLESYFAAGGASVTDIVTFHGYLYGAPELIVDLASNIKSVMAKHNLSSKPLWDTEHSWGDPSWPFGGDQDQQAAWLARYLPLSFSNSIDRSFWYLYDCYPNQAQWGCLYNIDSKALQKPGIAYREVYNWMINASMEPCSNSGAVYQCHLMRANGYEALILWNANASSNFTVPPGFVQYRDLDGNLHSTSAGTQISLGAKPVLLEKLK